VSALRFRAGRAVLAFFVVSAIAWPVVYEIAILVSPPVTSDGHPVMPIGHVALALLVSPIAGGLTGYFVGRVR